MSTDHAALSRFLSEDCTECGTPGPQRHLSAVGGCATCAAEDPRPVYIPVRNKGFLPYDLPIPPRRAPEGAPVFPPGLGFPSSPVGPYFAPFRKGGITPPRSPFGECYQMASGPMVHVRPGCRCKS